MANDANDGDSARERAGGGAAVEEEDRDPAREWLLASSDRMRKKMANRTPGPPGLLSPLYSTPSTPP